MSSPSAPTVLVVEDEYLIAIDIERIVQALGMRVFIATSCDAATRILEDETVSAAILDYDLALSCVSGPLTTELTRKGVRFAFCTGYARPEVATAFPGVPVAGKPFHDDDIVGVVRALH